jgi:hypothetical protein
MTSDNACVIVVFAKAAAAGSVKTRLIPQLGAAGAARLHLALVRQALYTALAARVGRVQLWCDDADAGLAQLAMELEVELCLQCAGDLGERMAHTFRVLMPQASRVILVGSDCPSRSEQDFRDAGAQLARGSDAVLGPTEDGGYHLIGLQSVQPGLFIDIDWSTTRVMGQTRARLHAAALRWHELPMRWDVDRPADLARLLADPLYAHLSAELPGV